MGEWQLSDSVFFGEEEDGTAFFWKKKNHTSFLRVLGWCCDKETEPFMTTQDVELMLLFLFPGSLFAVH